MLNSRPQGAAYRTINGQPFIDTISLSEIMFDGKPLWDKQVLNFTLALHFDKTISEKAMREQFTLEYSPHLMVPWIERYIEEAERLNAMNRLESVSMKECSDRANKSMMTPNQAEMKIARPTIKSTVRR
jgi:hypothetical protein